MAHLAVIPRDSGLRLCEVDENESDTFARVVGVGTSPDGRGTLHIADHFSLRCWNFGPRAFAARYALFTMPMPTEATAPAPQNPGDVFAENVPRGSARELGGSLHPRAVERPFSSIHVRRPGEVLFTLWQSNSVYYAAIPPPPPQDAPPLAEYPSSAEAANWFLLGSRVVDLCTFPEDVDPAESGAVTATCIGPVHGSGATLAAAGFEAGMLILWSLEDDVEASIQVMGQMRKAHDCVSALHFCGTTLVSAGSDGRIKLWRAHDGGLRESDFGIQCFAQLRTELSRVRAIDSVAVSGGSRRLLVSATDEGTVSVWNVDKAAYPLDREFEDESKLLACANNVEAPVTCIASINKCVIDGCSFSPLVAAGSADGTVLMYSTCPNPVPPGAAFPHIFESGAPAPWHLVGRAYLPSAIASLGFIRNHTDDVEMVIGCEKGVVRLSVEDFPLFVLNDGFDVDMRGVEVPPVKEEEAPEYEQEHLDREEKSGEQDETAEESALIENAGAPAVEAIWTQPMPEGPSIPQTPFDVEAKDESDAETGAPAPRESIPMPMPAPEGPMPRNSAPVPTPAPPKDILPPKLKAPPAPVIPDGTPPLEASSSRTPGHGGGGFYTCHGTNKVTTKEWHPSAPRGEFLNREADTCFDGTRDDDLPPLPLDGLQEPVFNTARIEETALNELRAETFDAEAASEILESNADVKEAASRALLVKNGENLYDGLIPIDDGEPVLDTVSRQRRAVYVRRRVRRPKMKRPRQPIVESIAEPVQEESELEPEAESEAQPESNESAEGGVQHPEAEADADAETDSAQQDEEPERKEEASQEQNERIPWYERAKRASTSREDFYLTRGSDGTLSFCNFHSLRPLT